jgi:hypothetical protein
VKTQFYQILSVLAIVAYFIPLLLIWITKRTQEKSFLLLSLYWSLNGVINLVDKLNVFPSSFYQKLTLIYNMIDIPMVMGILWFTTNSKNVRKFASIVAPSLVVAQLVSFVYMGWVHESAKYVMAASLTSILVLLFWEISIYMQKLEHTATENAIVFMHVSWLFAYGTFVVIYIFEFYVKISGSEMDNFLIYYISSLIAVAIASIGFSVKNGTTVPMKQYHGY